MSLEEYYAQVPVKRKPARRSSDWRKLIDGSPSSDGVQADIAGLARLIFGPPGVTNHDGVWWAMSEERGAHSKAGWGILGVRGVVAGKPEGQIRWNGQIIDAEIKRPGEPFTAAQLVTHAELAKAGFSVRVWRGREDFYRDIVSNGIPHRKVVF